MLTSYFVSTAPVDIDHNFQPFFWKTQSFRAVSSLLNIQKAVLVPERDYVCSLDSSCVADFEWHQECYGVEFRSAKSVESVHFEHILTPSMCPT